MELTADTRRQTQTFCSADAAEQKMHSYLSTQKPKSKGWFSAFVRGS